MMRIVGGIFQKIFIYTTILIVSLLLVNFSAQQIFLSKYYKNIKIDLTEEKLKQLIVTLEDEERLPGEVQNILHEFSRENKAAVEIVNKKGEGVFGNISRFRDSHIYIKTNEGELFGVSLEGFDNIEVFKESKNVTVEGMLFKYGDKVKMILPYYIVADEKTYSVESGLNNEISEDGVAKVSGIITDITHIKKSKQENYYEYEALYNELTHENKDKFNVRVENEKIVYEDYTDKYRGTDFVSMYTSLKIFHEDYVIMTSISIDSIEDTMSILKIFNKYALGLAVALALIAVFIYSRSITKPVMKLKRTASRMAGLDFTARCDVKSKDELAELGNSLNLLSKNLDTTLKELRVANSHLEKEVELERKREKSAKELIANMSHELKTPLTVIEGIINGIYLGVYEMGDLNYIDSISEEVIRMKDIIFDMLQLSKIEADVYRLNEEVFDVSSVVLKVHSKLKNLSESKNLNTIMNIQEALIFGDKKKIESVITNFYSNAIRYTEKSNDIIIEAKNIEDEVEFSIENKGAHIEEEDLENIWDAFYRVEKSRSRALGGTGLGLRIVRGILELHNYKYGVENTAEGVKFYFRGSRYIEE